MTIANQKKTFTEKWQKNHRRYQLVATVRHDDECGNGHNSFAITGELYENDRWMAGGCLHDDIAEHFPELAPLIKWHLCSTDGPMHYPANALYHAGERDCWGKLKGEVKSTETHIVFGDNPITHAPGRGFVKWLEECQKLRHTFDFEVMQYDHDDRKTFGSKFTFGGFAEKWHECPFDTEDKAVHFLYAMQHCNPKFVTVPVSWGEGKEPDPESARACAIWPDATLEQLQDKEALEARLPGLMAEFRAAVESLDMTF